jgi:hypothetical protein
MKTLARRTFLVVSMVIFGFLAFTQNGQRQPDEGMDMFLLVIAGIGICAMLGGAFVAAFFATIILAAIAALAGFGIFSASVVAGLYTRSVSTVFKTFFIIVFAMCTAICTFALCLLAQHIFQLKIPGGLLYIFALPVGVVVGGLIGFASYTLFQKVVRYAVLKFKTR